MENKYDYSQEHADRIYRIFETCYEINCYTPFAAFFSYSGHTNQIDIRIFEKKTEPGLSRSVANNKTLYLNDLNSLEDFDKTIATLDLILKENRQSKIHGYQL